jgi:hypothetical protein
MLNHGCLRVESLDPRNESDFLISTVRGPHGTLHLLDIPLVIIGAHVCTQALNIFGLSRFDVTVADESESVLVPPPMKQRQRFLTEHL